MSTHQSNENPYGTKNDDEMSSDPSMYPPTDDEGELDTLSDPAVNPSDADPDVETLPYPRGR
ncbi:uncharacterized protein H6S33_008226 [Morchella sextelata]|uniref:uncharacterized protein n=1 Tax=Morchella sextelata TaxID=1174677 RepID=UPI001D037566|nr:uncharacterized protein H6S33_008226 [Morchella sextelata]KAH0603222.1 hypothetical protein H6S33_008226 [Morchella sextelata]